VTTVNRSQGQAQATRKTLPIRPARKGRASTAIPQIVREEYGLSQTLFARLLGVDKAILAKWEKTGKLAKNAQAKFQHVADLLSGLSRVLPKAELAGWLTKPSDACRSAGGETPADLMEKGRYEQIEAMIYFFESGVAY
jgi:DNA-binding transcriptional regulator YiaG